jgi:hypothetical protein
MRAQQFHQQILDTPQDGQCWSEHVACLLSDVEEILKFKTFESFKKQVACETDNN